MLVCAPTGTGKTIIADWIVEQALNTNHRVVYTAPIKALSNQKFRDYVRLYGAENVGLVTGDLVIRRDAPCLVMTTEILRNILLSAGSAEGGPENHPELRDLLAVVIDEIHFLDDRERGTVWEEVLIYLPSTVHVVGLSATLSNVKEFAAWLSHVRQGPVDVVQEHKRAVPLQFHYFSSETGLLDPERYDRSFRKRSQSKSPGRGRGRKARERTQGGSRTTHIDVFRAMDDRGWLPYLYFVFSRRDTEILARALVRWLNRADSGPRSLLDESERAASDLLLARASIDLGPALDDELRAMYRAGVAFHHAGLHVHLKGLVEELYEQRLIKVLYCTSTFALGINMPARGVVFDGIKKFDGRAVAPLTTRGFMQKAGRAGRRGMDDVGQVVIRMDIDDYPELKPILERYARGNYEPVRSSFNLSFHSIVNLLERYEPERIRHIVNQSFLAWHASAESEPESEAGEDRPLTKAERKAEMRRQRDRNRTWEEFQLKVTYLKSVGYLDADGGFNAGARVLKHLQISEIFVTELVLSGLLEDLSPPQLFGVLCGMTNSLPRHVHAVARPKPEERALARRIAEIRDSPIVSDAESLSGIEVVWDPDVMLLGRGWAEGVSLLTLMTWLHSDTDVSGDLVTGFRRAKDLVGQLLDVYAEIPDRIAALKQLLRAVSRDEVEVVG